MNRQQINEQLAYVRNELTCISQELAYAEDARAQSLRIRQSRLVAELHRLESVLRDGIAATAPPPR